MLYYQKEGILIHYFLSMFIKNLIKNLSFNIGQ